ncbi:leucine--tRNA ligase [[Mycoplasma] testudinis]|uniref:leucine--tRNA ligase n=1 Tax=[Mycoplasma] testudinis TaxID=33924 RepID=UPI000482857E|nr:leucine--tRNA ligase [[Mycoplasma] testudinis]
MYNHNEIEKKWIQNWQVNKTNKFYNDASKPKFYVLDMFPYPSGSGLHVGHVKGYTATDILSRYKKACGFNVLHPIGFDAFGLPAEQYAIKTGNHPEIFTLQNIAVYEKQMTMLGFDYDFDLKVVTSDASYYQWTQWIFSQIFKHGLAEVKDINVNWCEQLGTVLSNEEVVYNDQNQPVSERGGFPVVHKKMRQWVLKITHYADKLIDGLNEINWSNSIKTMQREWIGKTTGVTLDFAIENSNDKLSVFTTRADTLYGVSYLVVAPENEFVTQLLSKSANSEIQKYIDGVLQKSDLQRKESKSKSGIFSGVYALHPLTKKKLPIWIAEYVLNNFGTGIVMGVPAHDDRDFEFAQTNHLPIINVIENDFNLNKAYTGDGKHLNSEFINGLNNDAANEKMLSYLVQNKIGKTMVVYRLQDWIFSRQRYWGEPFPILFDNNNKAFLVEDLPLVLPPLQNYAPNKDGLAPLANAKEWIDVVINNQHFKRETNTMPNWAGSCWYYLGYLMKIGAATATYWPINSPQAQEMFKRFLPVDVYVGGQEHAVLHLLYARFWHRFLYDIKVVPTSEPFMHLINQGMILGPDGTKMSKSTGNVVNPNEIVASHGADALRLYETFMGPIAASLPWNTGGLNGSRKWLDRVYNLYQSVKITDDEKLMSKDFTIAYHQFVKEVCEHLERYENNLVVSAMMVFINHCYKQEIIYKNYLQNFLVILSFICPFIAEELNEKVLNNKKSISVFEMPKYDAKYLIQTEQTIRCMINGKFRGVATFALDAQQQEIEEYFRSSPKTANFLKDKKIKEIKYIPNKVITFIVE